MKLLKKHPYVSVTIATIIVCAVVWMFMPKQYAAQTKIVDEYKETDLAVGLDNMTAAIKDAMGKGNEGINDIEVYSKALNTEDFARRLSHCKIASKGITYGEHLADEDTVETILGNINYKFSTKEQSVTIELKDYEALVAAEMLDSIVAILQAQITNAHHFVTEANLRNAITNQKKAQEKYIEDQKRLAVFVDSHSDITDLTENSERVRLEKERDISFNAYQKSVKQTQRQRYLLNRPYFSFATVKSNAVPTEDCGHPIGYSLFAITLALLFTKGFQLYKQHDKTHLHIDYGDIFSPWTLAVGIWIVDLTLCFLQRDMLYPIRETFWYSLAAWLPFFVISSFFACYLAQNNTMTARNRFDIHVNLPIFNILWCISMCLSPLYIYKVMTIVTQFDTENLLYNIRLLAVSGEGGSLILNSVQAINIALFITAIWLYPQVSKFRIFTIIVAYLTVEFAMMEKSGVLIMILSTLFVLHQKGKIRMRTIVIILACTIFLFYFINMSKEEKDQDSMTFLDFFGMYITTPAVAFSYLKQDICAQFGLNTFSQVYQYSNLLGFNFDYVDRLQEFMNVPIPTNVYTIFQPFYEDFGHLGVAFFAIIYGSLFGWIYGKQRSGNTYCRLLYTYAVEIIIIQFYNENLLQNLFQSVGFICWSFLLAQQTITFTKQARR